MTTSFKRKFSVSMMTASVGLLERLMLNSNLISYEHASLVHLCSSDDSVHHAAAADRHAGQAFYIY